MLSLHTIEELSYGIYRANRPLLGGACVRPGPSAPAHTRPGGRERCRCPRPVCAPGPGCRCLGCGPAQGNSAHTPGAAWRGHALSPAALWALCHLEKTMSNAHKRALSPSAWRSVQGEKADTGSVPVENTLPFPSWLQNSVELIARDSDRGLAMQLQGTKWGIL